MKYLKSKLSITLIIAVISFFIISCSESETPSVESKQLSEIINKLTKDNVIEISSVNSNYSYKEKDGFEEGFASRMEPGDILCSGSGISFARCVKKNLDAGKTMKLYKKDGEYIAEEM